MFLKAFLKTHLLVSGVQLLFSIRTLKQAGRINASTQAGKKIKTI